MITIYIILLWMWELFLFVSSTIWKALGSPKLVLATNHLLAFNRRPSESLGILPQIPILLGGKIVCIDVMVVKCPLYFNVLLGWDYTYDMKVFMSTLFWVMLFPHNGSIMTLIRFHLLVLIIWWLLTIQFSLIFILYNWFPPNHRSIMWHYLPCLQFPMRMSLYFHDHLLWIPV